MDGQRCDKCPAPARARLDLLHGQLYFCLHHTFRYFPELKDRYCGLVATLTGEWPWWMPQEGSTA